MCGDMVSELRLAALYANQVARAIVWMDDRQSNFFNAMRSTHNTFVIDRSIAIDVLGTSGLDDPNLCESHLKVQNWNLIKSLISSK